MGNVLPMAHGISRSVNVRDPQTWVNVTFTQLPQSVRVDGAYNWLLAVRRVLIDMEWDVEWRMDLDANGEPSALWLEVLPSWTKGEQDVREGIVEGILRRGAFG